MYYPIIATPFDTDKIVEQQMESVKTILKPIDELCNEWKYKFDK